VMKLTEILSKESIVLNLRSRDRDGAIGELVDAIIAGNKADAGLRDAMLKAVLAREKLNTTGFGKGVAVPHVKLPEVSKIGVALGLSSRGIDFSAVDHQPVYIVLLLLSPKQAPEEHLKAMEVIFKYLGKESFRRSLRECQSIDSVIELIREADHQHLTA
jgi:mannitol/fructose-specific phosphotransferase system IIA component (Ntr-type)